MADIGTPPLPLASASMTPAINAYAPLVRQSFDSYHELLQPEAETYTYTDGIGYDSASFVLTGEAEYLFDWYLNGLVRHVEWVAPDGIMAFEGFVQRMSLTIGAVTRTVSIDGVYTRLIYHYRPLDTTQTPPTALAETSTTKNNLALQARYGVKVKVEDGSECTAATADDASLSLLEGYGHLTRGETQSVGRGAAPSLRVELQGYAHMCNWYNYTQIQLSGTVGSSTFIPLVLADDPNVVMSTSTVDIDDNTTAIERYQDGREIAWKLIQMAAARGYETGGYGYPWSVSMWEHRHVLFKASELTDGNGNPLATNKYQMLYRQTTHAGDSILAESGEELMPWAIRPDRLLFTVGFPDKEPMWIQQCRFSSPYTLDLTGTDPMNPVRLYMKSTCGK